MRNQIRNGVRVLMTKAVGLARELRLELKL